MPDSFPSLQYPDWNNYKETHAMPQRTAGAEGGHIMSTRRSAYIQKHWTIGWHFLPDEDYRRLRDFFIDNHGTGFYFRPPWLSASANQLCCFTQNKLSFSQSKDGRWAGSVDIMKIE